MATIEQIKADLTKKVGVAVENVKQGVVNIIMNEINRFYGEYDPTWYQRSYQIRSAVERMANSAVKTYNVGASFRIYVDSSMFNHIKGSWTEEMILDSVMVWGTHGHASPGTPVWTKSMEIINPRMQSIIKEKLIAAGIPVK